MIQFFTISCTCFFNVPLPRFHCLPLVLHRPQNLNTSSIVSFHEISPHVGPCIWQPITENCGMTWPKTVDPRKWIIGIDWKTLVDQIFAAFGTQSSSHVSTRAIVIGSVCATFGDETSIEMHLSPACRWKYKAPVHWLSERSDWLGWEQL